MIIFFVNTVKFCHKSEDRNKMKINPLKTEKIKYFSNLSTASKISMLLSHHSSHKWWTKHHVLAQEENEVNSVMARQHNGYGIRFANI